MEHLYSAALLLHLLAYAAWVGGGVAQQRFMSASRRAGLEAVIRDQYERLSAALLTKLELPAALVSIVSGLVILWLRPGLLKMPGMHMKLTLVALILVLTHLEMFNARRIVRLRESGGDLGAIADRKSRHAAYGTVGGLMVLGILVIVAFVIRG
ncbi:MAG TPA: hypothetical protein VF720_04445 [Candidatus Eisenbacteria bacterium]